MGIFASFIHEAPGDVLGEAEGWNYAKRGPSIPSGYKYLTFQIKIQ